MAIELVIKIPEDEYQNILLTGKASFCAVNAIEAGIPLPKRHGRLIDESKITKCEQIGLVIKDGNVNRCFLTDAPTIIEADYWRKNEKQII